MANQQQSSPLMSGRLFTIPEAVAHVRLSRTTLYNLMNDGVLPYVKIGKARRIQLSALIGLVEKNTHTGANDSK